MGHLKKSVFAIIFIVSASGHSFAQNGYWFDLFCQERNNKTSSYVCRPAIEDPWKFHGASYNYQYTTPKYDSLDEVSRDMEKYIDSKFRYCKPTKVSQDSGPINPNFRSMSYAMKITVGIQSNGQCTEVSGANGNGYYQLREVYCETGGQGPYEAINGYIFCAYPQKFNIDISGPSETHSLPSFSGPIDQTIQVTGEEGPAKNWSVSLKSIDQNGIASYAGGTTNEQGIYEFTYVPSYVKGANVKLIASCTQCLNIAEKIITVLPADLNQSEEPQICRR